MSLTLQVYHSPTSFIRGLEATVSNSPFDADTAHMNLILGTAYDAQGRDERSVWMVVSHSDCNVGEDSEVYTLPPIALPSQESEALKSPILLGIISLTCEKYDLSTPTTISNAGAEISGYLANVIACVVDITFGSHLPQVYSAFGPTILVDAFLQGCCTASKRKSNLLEINPVPFSSTTLAWMSKDKCVELYGNQASSQSGDADTIANQPALKAQAGYFTVDIYTLGDLVDVQPEPSSPGHNKVAFQGDKPLSITDQIISSIMIFFPPNRENRDQLAKTIVNEGKRQKGRLWICLLNSEDSETKAKAQPIVMGYLYVGRQSRRTASIRHVYTRDEYRRMGVASRLVKEASKWYLLGTESRPQNEATPIGNVGDEADVKEAVTLFVAPDNKAAVRTYSKVGFEIEQVPWGWRGFEGLRPGPF